jgi:hypothetical protein
LPRGTNVTRRLEFYLVYQGADTDKMSSVTASTMRPLSSVLGFDIIELWSTSLEGGLACQHYYHSDAVQQVVRKMFPSESSPFHPSMSESWMENSRQVITK